MAKKRTVKSENTVYNNPEGLKFEKSVRFKTLVMKADVAGENHRTYDLNVMKHEIHSDCDFDGGTGIIIGRTVSASIDKKGRVTIISEMNSEVFTGKKKNDFTLIPIGIGMIKKGIIFDYDFSCFSIVEKDESAFYNNGGKFKEQ
jgi:hypothetical protein